MIPADLKRFRPVFLFLLRFVGVYVAGNLLYGWYVEAARPYADGATLFVGRQVAAILNVMGYQTWMFGSLVDPVAYIVDGNKRVLDIFEGCNGLNVMIVFLAFLVGWGKMPRKYWWFPVAGILFIHLCNLARVCGLFWVALNYRESFYFMHKYLFTGILFVIVFLMWLLWVRLTEGRLRLKPDND